MCRVLAALTLVLAACVATPAHADGPDFSPFVETWIQNHATLSFYGDGFATLSSCAPPGLGGACTSFAMQFSQVIGSTADGVILPPSRNAGAPIWFTLLPNDLAVLMDFSPDPRNYITSVSRLFCGSQTPPAAIAVLGYPCGA